jgi:isoaspartyl peptidase/L-asparaginase-like protein (Ntn-hydrolase superfamily)
MRVGGDVEVLRRPVHQQVAHAPAAQVRAVAAAVEAVQNLEDVLGDAAAGDGVVRAIDDGRRDFCGLLLGGHGFQC